MSAPDTSMEAGPSRRAVMLSTAAAGLAAALVPGQGSAAAATGAAGPAVIRSAHLDVRVHTAFPGIASYTDRGTGAVIHGAPAPASTLLIDGAAHTPQVTSTVRADRIAYTLTFDGGTRIEAQIAVDGWTAEFRVTAIADTDSLRVGTLQIPGLRLLSVRSDQPGATLLAAKLQLDKAKSGDTLVRVTATTPPRRRPPAARTRSSPPTRSAPRSRATPCTTSRSARRAPPGRTAASGGRP